MRVDLQGGSVEFKARESVLSKIEASLQPGFEPVQPKYAATVMLVRDSAPFQTEYRIESDHFPPDFPTGQELEVFMLRRVKTMEFVPDAVVFPGGRVDDRDSNPNLPWCGPAPAEWAELMGCTEEVARRVVVAAAREVFEECGVLLAGPDEHSVVQDLSDPSWQEDRTALENHEIAFADMLILRGLVLRTDLLGLISNFCTPEFETKRYDTFFFSALMPEGQVADGETSEAQIADWVTPAYAMRAGDAGNWLVLAPTVYNLTCIASAQTRKNLSKHAADLRASCRTPSKRKTARLCCIAIFRSANRQRGKAGAFLPACEKRS